MKLRCFIDVRQLPLYIGIKTCLWSLIPLAGIEGSLFSRPLVMLGLDREWGWIMALSGLYLIFGAVFARREVLTVAMFLSACVWTTMTVLFFDAAVRVPHTMVWVTPVTLLMPVSALSLWAGLFREMLAQPIVIRERRRVQRD